MERIGSFLIFTEPKVCPEVAFPARKVQAPHTDTEWSVEASYEPSGYIEARSTR